MRTRTRTRRAGRTADQRPAARNLAIRLLAMTVALVLLALLFGCQPAANTVVIKYLKFNPKVLTVTAGTTVTWKNEDQTAHTITSDLNDTASAPPAQKFTSQILNPGETYTHKFDTPGTYNYHCSIHSYIKGTVVVK